MSSPIRVLLADDSVVIRRIVCDVLSDHRDVQIVGAAADGRQALELIESTHPDVMILDVEMPVMDGIATLKTLRQTNRRLPVIMFSSLTTRGAEATLDALAQGASDYVAKPAGTESRSEAAEYLNEHLLPLVLQWGRHHQRGLNRSGGDRTRPRTTQRIARSSAAGRQQSVELIAIGSSTGGPNALADVLKDLPADLPCPIVIVQHMPKVFTRLLAERLDKTCSLTVREGTDGAPIGPGEVWIAPGDYHMVVDGSAGQLHLRLNQDEPENSCRPAVDVLFRSVSEVCQGRCLAVVLTGMGKDGMEGCRLLKEKGARIVVQDEATCVVWGMPRAVAEAGLADRVLPLPDIASELILSCRSRTGSAAGAC